MMQQRREEYRVAPLARPIVKSATPSLGGAVGAAYGLLSRQPTEAETLALQTTRKAVTSKIGPFERPQVPTLPSLTQQLSVPSVGLAESLANIQVSPLIKGVPPSGTSDLRSQLAYVATGKTQQQQIRPFAGFAGLIAPAEATAYSVGQLFGYKTPNIPATIMGLPAKAWGYGPEYVVGSIYGEVFLAYGLGKAQQKLLPGLTEEVTKPITRPIQERASDWLTERAIEREPLESPSLSERFVSAITGAKPREMPSGLVDVPLPTSIPEYANIESVPKDMTRPLGPTEGFEYVEPVTSAEKEAVAIMKGATESPVKVSSLSPSEVEYIKNIMGFDFTPEQKAAYIAEFGKLPPNISEFVDEHIHWKFPLSYAEQAEPVKLVASEETLLTPESVKAIRTAEKLGIAPRTSMIDPFSAELVEPPTLLRPISGIPYTPTPELTMRTVENLAIPVVPVISMIGRTSNLRMIPYSAEIPISQVDQTPEQVSSQSAKQAQKQNARQMQQLAQQLGFPQEFQYEPQFFKLPDSDTDYFRRFAKKRKRGRGFMGLRGLMWPVPSPESLLGLPKRMRRKNETY